ncbi:MAG: MerR family transcriptional regulator [Lachnospiraceae bacterium]|nr:MerR family transcriptional regulator [Lachnospiraceae bacterium]
MKTVNEVSKLTGVSIRTLQYYDKIGLLKPAEYTESGYRLYDDAALERLQQILLFRELEFPLKDIKDIVTRSDFDKRKALDQQIELLKLKKEHIENLIDMCKGLKLRGVRHLDFKAFDSSKIDEYAKKAKEQWGKTPEFKEFEEKDKKRSKRDKENMMADFMEICKEFGAMKEEDPASERVQKQVEKLKNFITENFYNCTNEILSSLGKMYAGGGEFTENINKMGGVGTAEFTYKAIEYFCK